MHQMGISAQAQQVLVGAAVVALDLAVVELQVASSKAAIHQEFRFTVFVKH